MKMKKFSTHKRQLQGVITELSNLIERLRAMEKDYLQQEESLYVISEFANDWEYWQDPDGNYKYVSPSCESVTGYRPEEFYADKNILQKIIREDDWVKWKDHRHTMQENGTVEPVEFEIRTKIGEMKWIHHICRTVTGNDKKNLGIRGSNRDISDLKKLQEQLQHVAGHDYLTNLPNRLLFLEHLEQSIKQAQRQGLIFIIMYIDIDRFKEINDHYGHDAGDVILRRVARDLLKGIRKNDIVSRFGGDEFVALFNVKTSDDVKTIKSKILDKVSSKIKCYKYNITIRLSIGMSIYPQDGRTADVLLKKADTEMYAMKAKNKASDGGSLYGL